MFKTISNISDLFMYSLQLHGKASFPDLGTIQVYRKPASYSENRKKIMPPETSLVFDNHFDEQYSVMNLGLSLDVEPSILESWAYELKAFLHPQNNDETPVFHLAGIGNFNIMEGNISFKADDHGQKFNAFEGWPQIDVTPLSLNRNNIHFAIEQPRELIFPGKKKEKSISSFTIPLLLIGCVLIVLGIRFFDPNESKPIIQVGKKKNTLIHKENIIDETKQQTTTTIERNLPDSITQKKPSQVSKTNTITTEGKSKKINQPAIALKTTSSLTKKELSNAGHCSYIPGAFTRKGNAVNLKNKLQKEGYQVEILKNNNFYRVAVLLPCQNDTSAPFKKLITEYPDTWLLEE